MIGGYVSNDAIIDLAKVTKKITIYLLLGKRQLSKNRVMLLVPNLDHCIAFFYGRTRKTDNERIQI